MPGARRSAAESLKAPSLARASRIRATSSASEVRQFFQFRHGWRCAELMDDHVVDHLVEINDSGNSLPYTVPASASSTRSFGRCGKWFRSGHPEGSDVTPWRGRGSIGSPLPGLQVSASWSRLETKR